MSRIGKKPVDLPSGVTARMDQETLTIEASKGKLSQWIDPRISVEIDETAHQVRFAPSSQGREQRALHGLYRALTANMVVGVTTGFERQLEIVGIGYNAKVEGGNLVMQIGFCHPVTMPIPAGLQLECPKPATIIVRGMDKQQVGQFAADIRRVRPPEPYKGKGIRYKDEYVKRKAGKSVGA